MDSSQRATKAADQAVEVPVARPTTPPRRTAELALASAIESKNYSTPTRARQDKTDHTCDSVDDELEDDDASAKGDSWYARHRPLVRRVTHAALAALNQQIAQRQICAARVESPIDSSQRNQAQPFSGY